MTQAQFEQLLSTLTFTQVAMVILLSLQVLQYLILVVSAIWAVTKVKADMDRRSRDWEEVAHEMIQALGRVKDAVDESRKLYPVDRRESTR